VVLVTGDPAVATALMFPSFDYDSKRCSMKRLQLLAATLAVCTSFSASADTWVQGTVTEVQVVASGGTGDQIIVLGNFTPSMGCTYSGFSLFSTDPYFNQSYAAILAAQVSGSPIKVSFSYCQASGYGRANAYSLLH
jgi:hypothetical protein